MYNVAVSNQRKNEQALSFGRPTRHPLTRRSPTSQYCFPELSSARKIAKKTPRVVGACPQPLYLFKRNFQHVSLACGKNFPRYRLASARVFPAFSLLASTASPQVLRLRFFFSSVILVLRQPSPHIKYAGRDIRDLQAEAADLMSHTTHLVA